MNRPIPSLRDRAKAYINSGGEGAALVAELLHELNNKQQIIDGWRQLDYIPGTASPAEIAPDACQLCGQQCAYLAGGGQPPSLICTNSECAHYTDLDEIFDPYGYDDEKVGCCPVGSGVLAYIPGLPSPARLPGGVS